MLQAEPKNPHKLKNQGLEVHVVAQRVKNLTSIQEDANSIPQWVKDSGVVKRYSVGHRYSSDLALLWLWLRPATAAPMEPLAWELTDASGVALKKKKKKKKTKGMCLAKF